MRMLAALALVTTFIFSSPASAEEYDRLLVPVLMPSTDGVPGAYGSLWRTFLTGRNENDAFVLVTQAVPVDCHVTCPEFQARANSTFVPNVFPGTSSPGVFMYVQRPGSDNVWFNLRVQDLSRQASTWGTELPVIGEKQFSDKPLILLNIPSQPSFRVALRVYGWSGNNGERAVVEVFRESDGLLVGSETVTLQGAYGPLEFPTSPAVAQIFSLQAAFPAITVGDALRIRVTPARPTQKIWAFVSVTHDETQHVTMITPRP